MSDDIKWTKIEGDIKSIYSDIVEIKACGNDSRISLEKVVTQLEILNNNQNRFIVALIGIIGAQVGVEFIPHSPIPWMEATTYASRFFSLFAVFFLAFTIYLTKHNGDEVKYLSFGLLSLLVTITMGTVGIPVAEPPFFYIYALFRVLYCICFIVYSWKKWSIKNKRSVE